MDLVLGAHSLYVRVSEQRVGVNGRPLTQSVHLSKLSTWFMPILSGRSFAANSGFDNAVGWDNHPQFLENGYYNSMLSSDRFVQVLKPAVPPDFPAQVFWEARPEDGGHFMFNADMALAFDMTDFTSSTVPGGVSCDLKADSSNVCPSSSLLPQAQLYADNNGRFVRDFRAVFLKMISTGCGNGVCTAI
jgi:hypothetical protein